ncbi:MAG: D-ribose pyranase [Lawsonibacter sp.]|nr:D-ribose pyranase [Lawsonibacter sp.]
MVKSCVINAALTGALARARHKDPIVICDANMPIPRGCPVIDLSLTRGVPTLLQTLKAILNDLVAERYQVFQLMPQYNPAMYQTIQALLPQLPGSTISQPELEQVMQRAAAVVRTGDFGSCCTMVLYSASGMDKYVQQYDCDFPGEGQ